MRKGETEFVEGLNGVSKVSKLCACIAGHAQLALVILTPPLKRISLVGFVVGSNADHIVP